MPRAFRFFEFTRRSCRLVVTFKRKVISSTSYSNLFNSNGNVSADNKLTSTKILTASAGSAIKSYSSILRVKLSVDSIKQTHTQIVIFGFSGNAFLGTHLVKSYAKAEDLHNAKQVFESIPVKKNVFLWNAIIRACSSNELWSEVVRFYDRMEKENIEPDHYTLPFVIKGFSSIMDFDGGRKVHESVLRNGLEGNLHVVTCLIDMYANFGELQVARKLFDVTIERDVVVWTIMINAYCQDGDWLEVFNLFREMRLEGQEPSEVTFLSLVHVYDFSSFIHGLIIKSGFASNIMINTGLVDSYAKSGDVKSARTLFNLLHFKSSVSWSTMISGYTANGFPWEALFLFKEMFASSSKKLDHIGASGVLHACASLGSVHVGQMAHAYFLRIGFGSDSLVGNSLIDMYSKCGNISDACVSFCSVVDKNLVSWSTMIAGYGFHGLGKEAVDMFNKMQEIGIEPDNVAFLSLLSACAHSGLLNEAKFAFNSMLQRNAELVHTKHYASMIDLFARAGEIEEMHNFLLKLPNAYDESIWGVLLYACKGVNSGVAEVITKRLYELNPDAVDYSFLLCNIYASTGRWDEVAKIRSCLRKSNTVKTPGWSSIDVKCKVHVFHSGDTSHPENKSVLKMLRTIFEELESL